MTTTTRSRAAALAQARMLLDASPPRGKGGGAFLGQWGDGAPAAVDSPAPATRAALTAARPLRARVLIADDEHRIRLALRTCLEAEGYVVDEARDGREAIDAVLGSAPDVLVVDLAMPVLDGLSVLRELATLEGAARPRVIVLTAYGSISAAELAHELGAVAFLEKPVMPESLRAAVAMALRG
jgi:CheY-like chemotaxis protein